MSETSFTITYDGHRQGARQIALPFAVDGDEESPSGAGIESSIE